jgi:FADH2 O2-dependent halogenase
LPDFPRTAAFFTHFRGVRRLDDLPVNPGGQIPPYPVDDAAVHHVFDGGWIWVLRFRNGITSAGVAATSEFAAEVKLHEGAAAWQRILDRLPTVQDQFAAATPELPFVYAPRLSFRSGLIAGRRWALLPSAAGFVDPLLSTGFPFVLLGMARLAQIFEQDWESPRLSFALSTYASRTQAELLATGRLIGGLYASMSNFPLFVGLSLFYFAAASFSETARRLGKPDLADAFLLSDNPSLDTRRLLERARQTHTVDETQALCDDIVRAIEPFNVAGLGDRSRHNWYPANAEDMLTAASKFGATREEAGRLLERCGFFAGAGGP